MITEDQKNLVEKLDIAITALQPLFKEASNENIGIEISIMDNGDIGTKFFSKRKKIKSSGVFGEYL